VDPVPNPLLLRKSGSAANRTRTFGSVARNSDHYTTKAVTIRKNKSKMFFSVKLGTSSEAGMQRQLQH
jgi:hypothetical protein